MPRPQRFDIRKIAFDALSPLLPALRRDGLAIEPIEGVWLGAFAPEGELAGVARLSAQDGVAFVDDVWVRPAVRGRGAGSALVRAAVSRGTPLWLICDEDAVAYYAGLGFERASIAEFPDPLGLYYSAKGEWPEASDHVHVAMVARDHATA
jgi:GNAT superfamily N-acetyltransferase